MPKLTKKQVDRLREIYEELKAIESSLPIHGSKAIEKQVISNYNHLIQELEKMEGQDLSDFKIYREDLYYSVQSLKVAVSRSIAHLRTKYNLEEDKIVGIGNVIQIIQDEELKSRCLDLLSAKGNFDRVIREATTILENRIRTLSDPKLREVGVKLVDRVLSPTTGLLTLDGEPNEQEGFYQLYRGVMLSFRDETHHRIVDRFTREDAIKTLAFIDILLETLKKSKPRHSP